MDAVHHGPLFLIALKPGFTGVLILSFWGDGNRPWQEKTARRSRRTQKSPRQRPPNHPLRVRRPRSNLRTSSNGRSSWLGSRTEVTQTFQFPIRISWKVGPLTSCPPCPRRSYVLLPLLPLTNLAPPEFIYVNEYIFGKRFPWAPYFDLDPLIS